MSTLDIQETPQREFRLRGPLSRRALLRYLGWRAARVSHTTQGQPPDRTIEIDGKLGMLRFVDNELGSAQSRETDGGKIVQVYAQRNTRKPKRLLARLDEHG